MQASRGRELQFLLILDLDTRRGVTGQHHFPAALYPHGNYPRYHWIGGWVGLTESLDIEVRGNILCPYWESNFGRPVCSQTLYWCQGRTH
jgi:hypothetical protein